MVLFCFGFNLGFGSFDVDGFVMWCFGIRFCVGRLVFVDWFCLLLFLVEFD